MEEITLPNQGHTLACMIRNYLFENGASFAACIVPHPLNTDLTVKIQSETITPKECLLQSLQDARQEVEYALSVARAHALNSTANETQ